MHTPKTRRASGGTRIRDAETGCALARRNVSSAANSSSIATRLSSAPKLVREFLSAGIALAIDRVRGAGLRSLQQGGGIERSAAHTHVRWRWATASVVEKVRPMLAGKVGRGQGRRGISVNGSPTAATYFSIAWSWKKSLAARLNGTSRFTTSMANEPITARRTWNSGLHGNRQGSGPKISFSTPGGFWSGTAPSAAVAA